MAIMKKTVAPKAAKLILAVETCEFIEAQAAAFLQVGGEIRRIAKGVSGQVYGPSRQITTSKER